MRLPLVNKITNGSAMKFFVNILSIIYEKSTPLDM